MLKICICSGNEKRSEKALCMQISGNEMTIYREARLPSTHQIFSMYVIDVSTDLCLSNM